MGLAAVFCSGSVSAEPFAKHGTVAVGTERVFGINYTKSTVKDLGATQEDQGSSTSIAFLGTLPTSIGAIPRLNFDVFLGPGVSVGGGVMYQHIRSASTFGATNTSSDSNAAYILVAPRVGFGIPINAALAVWPRWGISYLHLKSEDPDVDPAIGTRTYSTGMWYTTLDALLLISPVQHVAFNVGPTFDVLIHGPSRKRNDVGVATGDYSSYSLGLHAGMTVWF
jgi:hypothetical protein